MADPRVLELRSIAKSLPDGRRLLEGVSLKVAARESVAILGKSGSGKSTLLSILGLIDEPDSGTYAIQGRETDTISGRERDRLRSEHIGFVFQRFALFSHLTALENVITPLRHQGGRSATAMKSAGMSMLTEVGMADAAHRRPRNLSGGEQQRVAIARALITRPRVILADEPTGSLDAETGFEIVTLLKSRVAEDDAALIVVTHEHDVAARMDTILHLRGGRFSESESESEFGNGSGSVANCA